MLVVQRVIHRRGKFLFQEIWDCFHKKSESWSYLDRWIGNEVTLSDHVVYQLEPSRLLISKRKVYLAW